MKHLPTLYRHNLALLTDLYQLTMAYGYHKTGLAEREAVFHLVFRNNPFTGGYSIACGLHSVIELLSHFRFEPEDVAYLATLKGNDSQKLFEPAFLDSLLALRFSCDVHAICEGTVVFPYEPLIRIRGPLLQCQILETALLNCINFETLIATKASRIHLAAQGEPVLEFGLRRAQGIDGSVSASRAAYVGGVAATSNVLAGKLFDIPVRGTHAHSWVMCFDDEPEAFEAYAQAMPNNCVFLVDTYNTLRGVANAIQVGHKLRQAGHQMVGIRLDSGDLAYLSQQARHMLDEAGFESVAIVASNDLDERVIHSLKQQGAAISVWGVGTKLSTAYDQPALGGVYKLAAIRDAAGAWKYKVKLSEQKVKISNPGIHQVRRFYKAGFAIADCIFDEELGVEPDCTIIDPMDLTRRKKIEAQTEYQDLLIPIFEKGVLCYQPPSVHQVRERTLQQLASLHTGIKRLDNPHQFPVGLERQLHKTKMKLIFEARGIDEE